MADRGLVMVSGKNELCSVWAEYVTQRVEGFVIVLYQEAGNFNTGGNQTSDAKEVLKSKISPLESKILSTNRHNWSKIIKILGTESSNISKTWSEGHLLSNSLQFIFILLILGLYFLICACVSGCFLAQDDSP